MTDMSLRAKSGEHIADYIKRAIAVAVAAGDSVDCDHNSTRFTVEPSHYQQVSVMVYLLREGRGSEPQRASPPVIVSAPLKAGGK